MPKKAWNKTQDVNQLVTLYEQVTLLLDDQKN